MEQFNSMHTHGASDSQDLTGAFMDRNFESGWTREDVYHIGGMDEESLGWWSCRQPGWYLFYVKVTKDGEERLFRRRSGADDDDLKMVDLLQCATHIHASGVYVEDGPTTRFAKVLKTAEDPAPFLENVHIHAGNVGDSGEAAGKTVVEAIASNKLPRLTCLDLENMGIDSQSFELLSANESDYLSSLKILRLKICDVGSDSHVRLAKAMESVSMPTLEVHELWWTKIGDSGCEAYAAAISAGKLPSLNKIVFRGTLIGSRGAQALGRAAMGLAELQHLGLEVNEIGDEGLKALVDSFQVAGAHGIKMSKLKVLKLSFNPFTEVGLLALAKGFSCRRIRQLDTLEVHQDHTNFKLSKQGAKAFVSALSNLKSLNLLLCPHLNQFRALKRHQIKAIDRIVRRRMVEEAAGVTPCCTFWFRGKIWWFSCCVPITKSKEDRYHGKSIVKVFPWVWTFDVFTIRMLGNNLGKLLIVGI